QAVEERAVDRGVAVSEQRGDFRPLLGRPFPHEAPGARPRDGLKEARDRARDGGVQEHEGFAFASRIHTLARDRRVSVAICSAAAMASSTFSSQTNWSRERLDGGISSKSFRFL